MGINAYNNSLLFKKFLPVYSGEENIFTSDIPKEALSKLL